MKSKNNKQKKQDKKPATKKSHITTSDGYVDLHDKHPAMTFVEFIDYRFMRKL